MNVLMAADIEKLLEDRPGLCISLYFPTFRGTARTPQGPIRLKNLLSRVGTELRAQAVDKTAIESLLGPLQDLQADSLFWATQEKGTALFRAPGFLKAFHLPSAFAERWVIGEHFFLKPLLPLVAGNEVFHVLALSRNEVRLLEATGRTVRRLAGRELPQNLVAALGDQRTAQTLQYHTAASSGAGAQPAIYHGQGVGVDADKEELRRFLSQVDAGVRKLLAGRATPLVLAGAEPLPSIYREISTHPHLAAVVIAGNPERATDEELRDRAWQLLLPTLEETRRRMAERFGELAGTGRASSEVREILPAARQGRVEALFLDCGADVWGRLDALEKVEVHPAPEAGDEELLDAAALFSLRHGGTVYGLSRGEVPGGGDLAAVFRF